MDAAQLFWLNRTGLSNVSHKSWKYLVIYWFFSQIVKNEIKVWVTYYFRLFAFNEKGKGRIKFSMGFKYKMMEISVKISFWNYLLHIFAHPVYTAQQANKGLKELINKHTNNKSNSGCLAIMLIY